MPDISAASGVATIVLALIGLAGAVHQLTKNSSRETQVETIISTLLLFFDELDDAWGVLLPSNTLTCPRGNSSAKLRRCL